MRLWGNKYPIIEVMGTDEEINWINKNASSRSGKTTYYENRSLTGVSGCLCAELHFNSGKRAMKKLDEILEKCKSHNKR